MKAFVRFASGERVLSTLRNIESDGDTRYGVVGKTPVSETTTIHHADGRVTKEWDEVVIMRDGGEFVMDKEDEYW